MADKSFGVKDINLIGASGTPEIESPNNLNINAVNVAISTDMSIGGNLGIGSVSPSKKLDVRGETTFGEGMQKSDLSWGTDTYQRTYFFSGASGGATTSPADGVVVLSNPNNNPSNTRVGSIVFGSSASGTSNTANAGIKAAIDTYTNTNVTNAADTGGSLRFLTRPDNGNLREVARFNSSGNLGIGLASPLSKTHIKGGSLTVEHGSPSTGTGQLNINSENNSQVSFSFDDQGHISFGSSPTPHNQGSFSEKLRIRSAGGITFNGDTAAANALDDYEEGSFTPTITWGGTSATLGGGTYGYYTKIGNTVIINFRIQQTARNTTSGTLRMQGLPFAEGSSAAYNHGMVQGDAGLNMPSTAGSIMIYIEGSNHRWLYQTPTGHGDLEASQCADGTSWYGFATYFTS